jgi:hypothetical protein
MSTKTTARHLVGSLRLVGATAAVAAGIAGFATVSLAPAASADKGGVVPVKACQNMDRAGVPVEVYLKHGCIVIPESGEITGGSIFG